MFIAQPGLTSLAICGSPYGSVSLGALVSLQCPRVLGRAARLVSAGVLGLSPWPREQGLPGGSGVHGAEAEVDGVVTYR